MRGKLLSSLIGMALLSGCATTQPGIKIERVEVPVVVTEKCITKEQVPTVPSNLGPLPADLEKALAVALAKVSEWTRYGHKTDVVLTGCTE